jgi:hypothetical protein
LTETKGGDGMRTLPSPLKITLASVLTLIAFAVNSCGPIEMKKVVVQQGAQYKFTSQQSGLKISVDPYTENDRLQASFGCDLLSRGILPVLVVVENLSSEDGYIIVTDMATMMTDGSINSKVQSDEEQKSKELERKFKESVSRSNTAVEMVEQAPLIGVLSPVIGVASFVYLPFALGAEVKYKDEIEIKRNLEQKQMLPKTVYQGGLQSGFLYFNLGKTEGIPKLQSILLCIRNVRTNELLSVTINMKKF